MTYSVIVKEDYLKHHGILGQKWGAKNGPPYPLAASDHSAAERKAMTGETKGTTTSNTSGKLKGGSQTLKLTDEQKAKIKKAAIIGAAAAGTTLAVYGLYKTGQLSKVAEIGKQAAKTAGTIVKESAKNAGTEFIKGIPAGAGEMGSKMGKVVGGGIMALAAKEVADIIVGEDTAKLVVNAYNSHNKKNKVNYNFTNQQQQKDDDD